MRWSVLALILLHAECSLSSAAAHSSYDYVIVGGGTAGLALANRLSEHSSVAVIEAGGFYEDIEPNAAIPGLGLATVGVDPTVKDAIDWNIVTTPQPGAGNRMFPYWRGKCLGGRCCISKRLHTPPTRS